MITPRVSVIVPNYNHAGFLVQRLESIFGQTLQDFELLFLDDASTDDSLAVVERFADDERFTSYLNQRNSGSPFAQWNRGFSRARGEFVWIAESDDFAEPTFLERLVGRLDGHPEAVMATCRSWITDAGGRDLEVFDAYHWFQDRDRWVTGYGNSGEDEITNYLSFQNTIPNASGVVFRRGVLDDGFRAPEDMRVAGDWLFWIELLLRGGIVHVGEPLNHFRVAHGASQRSRAAASGAEVLEGVRVFRFIDDRLQRPEPLRWRAWLHLLRRWLSIGARARPVKGAQRAVRQALLDIRFDTPLRNGLRVLFAHGVAWVQPLLRMPWVRGGALRLRDAWTGARGEGAR